MKRLFYLIPFLMVFVSCNQSTEDKSQVDLDNNAIDPANLDTTANPGENFYQYANGGWMEKNPLPDDKGRFGAFDLLSEKAREQVKSIFKELKNEEQPDGSIAQKIGDFYASGMNVDERNRMGVEPLSESFEMIDNISSIDELFDVVSVLHRNGASPLFGFYVGSDSKNSKMNIGHLYQGGLGLPNKDYYTDEDAQSEEIRKRYVEHIEKMLELANIDKAKEKAKRIFEIEDRLADASRKPLDLRDPHLNYNKMSVDSLNSIAKNVNWNNYFRTIGADNPGDIIVGQPDFFKEVSNMVLDVSINDWKTYLKWNVINRGANYLSDDFVNQDFEFYGKTLSGKKENLPRWKRVQDVVSGSLSEAVGKMYVEKYFPPEAKERMLDLVGNIRIALGERIAQLDWMSDDTKKNAHDKLDAINVKIGYPDKWKDYSDMEVKEQSYYKNVLEARRFSRAYNINKINQPVDEDEWYMPPQMVNAYYSSNMNEIVFPAAILQPPFFFLNGDDAVNYGAIGVVIGHELTHGFDDKGRLSDKDGNLNDWWTEQDAENFNARTAVLVNQFNGFTVIDEMKANGELSLGENLADLGGLNIAMTAFNKTEQSKSDKKIKGFTPMQRFFLAYAHVWAQNIRDEEIIRRTKTDVHSLGKYRVIGPLRNLPEFHKAFNIQETDYMYLPEEERAVIW